MLKNYNCVIQNILMDLSWSLPIAFSVHRETGIGQVSNVIHHSSALAYRASFIYFHFNTLKTVGSGSSNIFINLPRWAYGFSMIQAPVETGKRELEKCVVGIEDCKLVYYCSGTNL